MGHAFQSPLRRWEVLAGLVEQMKAKSFVEVGCKEGRTTGFLLANFPELHVTAIDPWAPVANSDEDYKDWDFAQIERDFWTNVGEHKDRCEMLRVTSLEAALIKENHHWQYDVVFIDAAHDYDNCIADIKLWWPHVREGGMLCGHDYQHKFPGVMRAVARCFPLLRVAVCPDSVWCVQKESDVRLAA
jgi:predicted O-methyltransferase YrrM